MEEKNSIKIPLKAFEEHLNIYNSSNDIKIVAFSPDGETLATGSSDNTVRLWDVKIVGKTGDFENPYLEYSSEGRLFISC